MATFLRCLFGPQLLRLNLRLGMATDYQPVAAENLGTTIITSISCAARMLVYASPIVFPWAMRQGWITFTLEGGIAITKFLSGVGLLVAGALLLRTLGRLSNPAYVNFITVLANTKRDYTPANKKLMSQYDFDFHAWPVDWDTNENRGDQSKPLLYLTNQESSSFSKLPMDILAWMMTHSFGISLVYPGSMAFMRMLIEKPLMEGRTKLFLEHGGERFKVATQDGNKIDTMFVDQRSKNSGSTLVLCCEGNAGFYEIGIMTTPISCGYSVLGWNHPGFYGSTGTPYPDQETKAVDAVMQFAINKLGFKVENIIVMGWSIGGYTATWLAMNYPDVKGLVLDATFDDLLPLAIPRMPASMSGLVTRAVKNYINLNVGDQLAKFSGPVRLIRRASDEMICTNEGELWSNRGNNLLLSLLSRRFPSLASSEAMDAVTALLFTPGAIENFRDAEMEDQLTEHVRQQGSSSWESLGSMMTDEDKGRMLCYLATKYMTDLNTTHCTPLPAHKLTLPWDPSVDSEFVTVENSAGGGDDDVPSD